MHLSWVEVQPPVEERPRVEEVGDVEGEVEEVAVEEAGSLQVSPGTFWQMH